MNFGLRDLWGEIKPQLDRVRYWTGGVAYDANRLCEREYKTEEAARFALQHLRWCLNAKHAEFETNPAPSPVSPLLERKIETLRRAKMPQVWQAEQSDAEISGRGAEEEISQKLAAVSLRQGMDEQGEERSRETLEPKFGFLDLPLLVQEGIFSELPPLSYVPVTCIQLKKNHDDFCVQHAQRLRELDVRSGLLSGLGITVPEQVTAETAIQLFKTVADKICIIYKTLPPDKYEYKEVGELLQDPDSLRKFLETVYNFSLKQIFGCYVAPDVSPDESRPVIDEWLKGTDRMYIFDLYCVGRFLVYLPKEIGLFPNLETLCVAGNGIMSIPAEIGHCTKLSVLRLKGNNLTSIPDEVRNLKELTTLDLAVNKITSLPAWLGSMPVLERIGVWDNPDIKIPPELERVVCSQSPRF